MPIGIVQYIKMPIGIKNPRTTLTRLSECRNLAGKFLRGVYVEDELMAAFMAMAHEQKREAIRAAADIICQRDPSKCPEAGQEEAVSHQGSGG